jgi:hypothetical protein
MNEYLLVSGIASQKPHDRLNLVLYEDAVPIFIDSLTFTSIGGRSILAIFTRSIFVVIFFLSSIERLSRGDAGLPIVLRVRPLTRFSVLLLIGLY